MSKVKVIAIKELAFAGCLQIFSYMHEYDMPSLNNYRKTVCL